MDEIMEKNAIYEEDFEEKRKSLETPQSNASMNVSKLDSKRLSYHDFGYRTGTFIRYGKKSQQIQKKVEKQTA